jgi:hypothetical protein
MSRVRIAPTAPGDDFAATRSGSKVLTPRRGNDRLAQGRASRPSRDAPPWVKKASQDPSPRRGTTRPVPDVITNHCEPDVNGWPRFAGFRRANRIGHVPREIGIRIISPLGFSRLWRVCRVFVSPRQGDGRGGVGRLPRAALRGCAASLCPGLTCFAPSGQGGFLTLGRFLRWWFFGSPPPRHRLPHSPPSSFTAEP